MTGTEQIEELKRQFEVKRDFHAERHDDNSRVLWLSAVQAVGCCERAIAAIRARGGAA